jgi:hypothetical protein
VSRKKNKRPKLFVAISHDARAQVAVVVVGLRGPAPQWWERVVPNGSSLRDEALALAIAAARERTLHSVVIASPDRLPKPAEAVCKELGDVRTQWIHRPKNLIERQRAHRRLRELAPLPPRLKEEYSWVDWGIDLENARFEQESSEP